MTLTRKWSLLAAVVVVAIFAAGWFLLISPKRSEAADLRQQASTQEADNARLVQKLEVLKAQQAELPKQRALLATYRTQIPDNPALPSLIRDLTAAGRKVGASIDELTPQPPVAAVSATGLTSPVGAAAAEGTTSTTDTTATTPAAPATQLFQVPLDVKVSGSYFELEQFVNKLEGLKRSFLVKGFTLKTSEDPDAAPGALMLDIQGQVFLAPETAPAAQPVPAASASATE